MSEAEIGLPEALERAASALPELADAIRPANGDPHQLARELDADAASRVLKWLLAEHTAAGEELALAWADDAEVGRLVLSLDAGALPKPARKVLKRLLHRLRSRGEAVPTPAPVARATTLAPLDEQIDEARLSAPDPYGARVVYLATDRPAGGVRIFQLVIQDENGVLEFELFETGRSKARRFLRDMTRRARWPAVEVGSDSARLLIAEALARHPADRALPAGLSDWKSKLGEHPADAKRPGEAVRETLAPEPDFDADALEAWLAEGEVGPWPPSSEALADLLARLDEIAEGRVVVSEAAREEQIDSALESALDAVYDADRFARLAGLFDDTAYVWWKAGRESDAGALLAAASVCREGAPSARRLARRMLEIALQGRLEQVRKPEPAAEAGEEASAGAA